MSLKPLDGKVVLITGGTGSLGKVLTRRLLSGEMGDAEKIIIFSRDEAKQHFMRLEYQHAVAATDEVIYRNFRQKLVFRVGDVRDLNSVITAIRDVDVIFNAAALKQVPTCEYFPVEAVSTNVLGPENIVRAIEQTDAPIETVIGISTDKACKPVNVMGMTKALQERVFVNANLRCGGKTRFICVRYGNVLASRGSVIPLFHDQIAHGGPVTITTPDMTRFLLSLDEAVDLIFDAVKDATAGETYIPRVPAALVANVAKALIGSRDIKLKYTGIRPGEKIHEILVSEEEAQRTIARGNRYVILPILPELSDCIEHSATLTGEYSSRDDVLSFDNTVSLLEARELMIGDVTVNSGEFLR